MLYFQLAVDRVFDVDNHIIVHASNYRGRSVTESNVQDYISNIVSKYLPANKPPWQICVIPIIGPAPSTVRPDEMASTSLYDSDVEAEQQQSANDPSSVMIYLFMNGECLC